MKPWNVLVWMLVISPTWLVSHAAAQSHGMEPVDAGDDGSASERTTNRVNMRIGLASSDDNGRPTICMEVRAVSRLSVEACGTGMGFLHDDPGSQLAHFRAKWRIHDRGLRDGLLHAQLGLGFAELQIGADKPGFMIRPEENGVEAIGPEAALSVQWLRPLHRGWELVVNTSAGLAWIPYADDLVVPHDTLHPFVSLEVGVGW